MTPWQSKEDQRAHIRAQLEYERNNPDVWYPISKQARHKLKSKIKQKPEKQQKEVP